MSTTNLEAAWSALCADAGWTPSLYGTADLTARMAYEAAVDALAAEREGALRTHIAEAKRATSDRFDRAYVEGIEAALDRAIASPRQPRNAA